MKDDGEMLQAPEPLPDTVANVIAAEDTSMDDEGCRKLMSAELQFLTINLFSLVTSFCVVYCNLYIIFITSITKYYYYKINIIVLVGLR